MQGLEKLRERRLNWVKALRENNFEEGVARLLTEIYPDNAHFIYELLQNAEDARAHQVTFVLSKKSLRFEHDGEKLFNLEDIDSITSIGVSTKRNDPTLIGKFGVGFKAVFAYTQTPEIQSGDIQFRIRELVVPDILNGHAASISKDRTRFNFPFDNPKKKPSVAIEEIQQALLNMSDNSLLFLEHIKVINYKFFDGSTGSIERIEYDTGKIQIKTQINGEKSTVSNWLRFQEIVKVTDEDGEDKDCGIAVAYELEKNEPRKQEESEWKILPIDHGQVSIYFPAEKETSNLKFHLHASFASTVARDSVRDCQANNQLRDHLASLVVNSLHHIRDMDLLTMSFLAVCQTNTTDFQHSTNPYARQL